MIKIMDWGEKRRYEEPHPVYLNKENIGGMNECHEKDGDFTAIWTKEERPVVFLVKETPEEILAMHDIETTEKVIDWEQRRFEIAREVLSYAAETSRSILMSGHSLGDDAKGKTFAEVCASSAISFADALINELKKGQDND